MVKIQIFYDIILVKNIHEIKNIVILILEKFHFIYINLY
jgi:hypothetical protein